MKKIICFTLLTIIYILPFNTKAFSIDSLSITGSNTAQNNEQTSITLQAKTSGYNAKEGIWVVYTSLQYDKSKLSLLEISTPGFNTVVEYIDGGAEIYSLVIENSNVTGMCVNDLLYCGTYTANIKFKVTNVTQKYSSSINTTEFGIGTVDMVEDRDYTIDDAVEHNYPTSASHTILLEPVSTTATVVAPVKQSSPTTVAVSKSNNNYLKSLEITDYPINFNKDTTEYNLTVGEDVTFLKIYPAVDYERSTYNIVGNKNLKNGSIIKITVTSEDGQTKDYNLNITKNKTTTEVSINNETSVNKDNKINNELNGIAIKVGIIVVSVIFVIALICIICRIKENKKLNKLLKEDKF